MSRQNASESFRQKVKQFFGVKKGHAIPSSVYEGPKADDRVFHHELLQDIGKNSPLANRVKYLRDLCDFLINKRVEDSTRTGPGHWNLFAPCFHDCVEECCVVHQG